jgi:hypothetical protein
MVEEVSPAVVRFQLVEDTFERPFADMLKPPHGQGINSGLYEGEWWTMTYTGSAGRFLVRVSSKAVPVVEMSREVERRLAHMDHADDEPGYASLFRDALVDRLVVYDNLRQTVSVMELARVDDALVPEVTVA